MTGAIPTTPGWQSALAYALTGEWLPIPESGEPNADVLVAELERIGWTGPRLVEAARQPRCLPDGWVRTLGPARYAAVLADLRVRLGVSGVPVRAPGAARPLNPEERRLVADRPPHWG